MHKIVDLKVLYFGTPGTSHVDATAWDPLIMKFCDFFGDAVPLRQSRLADAWRIPR